MERVAGGITIIPALMIASSLQQAIDFAKANGVPRVLEMKCPQCKETIYACTDDAKHEHLAWFETLKQNKKQRYVSCKRCGYGMMGQSSFIFTTHEVQQQ